MTAKEAVNWIINISADIGKSEHRDLWHYEQALSELRELLEGLPDVPNINDGDTISRKAALDKAVWIIEKWLPSTQPEQTDCEYCHEDSDGFVRVLERNGHAVIHGDILHLKAKGWRGEVKIDYCPMCGRRLTDE